MLKTLKAIAIDDEYKALEIIESYVERVPFLSLLKSFRDPIEALEYINQNEIDILFLDINMPELSGISFTKFVNPNQKIIFTTAYSEFAIDGFSLNALDYLLKPIEYERFLEACYKAKNQINLEREAITDNTIDNVKKCIMVKSGSNFHQIWLDELLFLEKKGNNMLFHTEKSTVQSRMNMQDVFKVIPEGQFCRVHKSFVVAIKKIEMISNFNVTINSHKVPIGRLYKADFLDRIKLYTS